LDKLQYIEKSDNPSSSSTTLDKISCLNSGLPKVNTQDINPKAVKTTPIIQNTLATFKTILITLNVVLTILDVLVSV